MNASTLRMEEIDVIPLERSAMALGVEATFVFPYNEVISEMYGRVLETRGTQLHLLWERQSYLVQRIFTQKCFRRMFLVQVCFMMEKKNHIIRWVR